MCGWFIGLNGLKQCIYIYGMFTGDDYDFEYGFIKLFLYAC